MTSGARKLTLTAAILALCTPAAAQLTAEQAEYGVCCVKTFGAFKMTSTGTGFFVAPNLILTAKHVVEYDNPKRIEVQTSSGNSFAAKVVARGPGDAYSADYALLECEKLKAPVVLKLAKRANKRNPTYTYGDFRVRGGVLETPAAAGYCHQNSFLRGMIWCTSHARQGYSGGPVVDNTGRVVGITSRACIVDQSCIFIPIETVRKGLGW